MLSVIKKTIIIQIAQFLFLVSFIVYIYQKELWFVSFAKNSLMSFSWHLIPEILLRKQLPGIPFKIWLAAWPLFLVSISLILFKRARWFFLGLAGFFTSLYITVDKLSLEYFSVITSFSSYKALPQLWDIRASVANVIPKTFIIDVAVLLSFILFGFIANKIGDFNFEKNKLQFAVDKTLGILAFVLSLYAFNLAFFFERNEVLFELNNDGTMSLKLFDDRGQKELSKSFDSPSMMPPFRSSINDYAASFGVVNYHIKDILSTLFVNKKRDNLKIAGNDLEYIKKWFESRQELNKTESPFYGIAKGRNIIVISMESFHPRVIGSKVDSEEVTPVINSLIKDSLSWDYCISQGFSGGTSDSEFSLMTGLLPEVAKISAFELPKRIKFIGLPALLHNHGYTTMSFHGNRPDFWNRNVNHPLYGIDKMFFSESFKGLKKLAMGPADDEFFARSAQYMHNEKSPFFSYLITLSAHNPYDIFPDKYKELWKNIPGNETAINYLRITKYADFALGRFIDELKRNGLWDNSVLIIFGDHTPPMTSEAKDTFGRLVHANMEAFREDRVPLIICIPGMEEIIKKRRGGYVNTVVTLNDIYPSILHLLGIDPPGSITGMSLFLNPEKRDPVIVSGFNNRFWAWKNVVYDGATGVLGDSSGIVFEDNSVIDDLELRKKIYQDTLKERAIYRLIYSSGHGIGM